MLYKNNRCNEELAEQIKNGNFQFFDCPPILYSPTEQDELRSRNLSHSVSARKLMRSSLQELHQVKDEEADDEKKPSLWSVLA